MQNISELLRSALIDAISQIDGQSVEVAVERPKNREHGDYTSNVALLLFSKLTKLSTEQQWKKPSELAQYLVNRLQEKELSPVSQITIVEPGFINFHLSREYLTANLGFLARLGTESESSAFAGQNIVVEFTDPNPFKEFHIGHLYSNTVGESISRLLEAGGATVWRADYFGDVGMHVAKSIWGMLELLKQEGKQLTEVAALDLPKRIAFLGQAYALGAKHYTEDEQAAEDMKQLNFLVYKAGQDRLVADEGWQPVIDYDQYLKAANVELYNQVKELYFTGRKWSLEYFDSIYHRLGMKFDGYYPESKAGEWGTQIVREQLENNVFEASKGAIIFAGSRFGLHDRVFINSLGLPTYEAKELALPKLKQLDFAYDRSVIITGNEINEYFKVLLKALSLIQPETAEHSTHIGHGMVRLPEGKMSSRTGKVLTGSWLLDTTKAEVLQRAKAGDTQSPEEREQMAELVGQAAIKYSFLKQSIGGDITFSLDEALDFQGNSGPYLLYTYVRTHNVLAQAASASNSSIDTLIDLLIDRKIQDTEKYTESAIDILRELNGYIDAVELAIVELAPHHLSGYLYGLAQFYNTWYAREKIVVAEGDQLVDASLDALKLNLIVSVVLRRGLYLLGIRTVDKM